MVPSGEPIPDQSSKRGITATNQKKVLAMVVLTRGPSVCSFCEFNYGHRISSCPKYISHGKHLIESEVDSLIDTLHRESLLMRGESVEENLILQNLAIK